MKTRHLLCENCKNKIRKVEAEYKAKRRKLKIKLKALQENGQVTIKNKGRRI